MFAYTKAQAGLSVNLIMGSDMTSSVFDNLHGGLRERPDANTLIIKSPKQQDRTPTTVALHEF